MISDELDEDFQSTCRHVERLSGGGAILKSSSILESYCYVMHAGHIRNRWRGAVSFPSPAECAEEVHKTISGSGMYVAPPSVTTNCAKYCWHRRFFLLKESQHVGLGSGTVLPGKVPNSGLLELDIGARGPLLIGSSLRRRSCYLPWSAGGKNTPTDRARAVPRGWRLFRRRTDGVRRLSRTASEAVGSTR